MEGRDYGHGDWQHFLEKSYNLTANVQNFKVEYIWSRSKWNRTLENIMYNYNDINNLLIN